MEVDRERYGFFEVRYHIDGMPVFDMFHIVCMHPMEARITDQTSGRTIADILESNLTIPGHIEYGVGECRIGDGFYVLSLLSRDPRDVPLMRAQAKSAIDGFIDTLRGR